MSASKQKLTLSRRDFLKTVGVGIAAATTAKLLAGGRSVNPTSFDEVRGHNTGVDYLRSLRGYLQNRKARGPRFFRKLIKDPEVVKLLTEVEDVIRQWEMEDQKEKRKAFDVMHEMRSIGYAIRRASELAPRVLSGKALG